MTKQVRANLRNSSEDVCLSGGELVAQPNFLQDLGRDGYVTNLRKHGGELQFPGLREVKRTRERPHVVAELFSTAERLRLGGGKNPGQHVDAAVESFFQQLPFGGDEMVLSHRVLQGMREHFGGAGFIEELINVPLVDSFNRGLLVGIPREHEADRIGGAPRRNQG